MKDGKTREKVTLVIDHARGTVEAFDEHAVLLLRLSGLPLPIPQMENIQKLVVEVAKDSKFNWKGDFGPKLRGKTLSFATNEIAEEADKVLQRFGNKTERKAKVISFKTKEEAVRAKSDLQMFIGAS